MAKTATKVIPPALVEAAAMELIRRTALNLPIPSVNGVHKKPIEKFTRTPIFVAKPHKAKAPKITAKTTTPKPKMVRPPTPAMIAALKLIKKGKDPVKLAKASGNFHAMGATYNCINAMKDRGYITPAGKMTVLGLAIIKAN